MCKLYFVVLVFVLLASPGSLQAQRVDDYLAGEEFLYAETKQVNQFFRRFNGEENERGVRLSENNRDYRDDDLRKNYLQMLFDNETAQYPNDLKKEFVKDIIQRSDPQFLDFHADGWFAEVKAEVLFEGKQSLAILFLKLEQEHLGYKWVFDKVYFEPFDSYFEIDTTVVSENFMHPMSHEIDFMNLKKVFDNKEQIEEYAYDRYQPDYLSLFLYEIKKSNLTFRSIKDVKFHFFQVDNWYFEISEFNRSGYNKGWLISNLVKATKEQKQLLSDYIYLKK